MDDPPRRAALRPRCRCRRSSGEQAERACLARHADRPAEGAARGAEAGALRRLLGEDRARDRAAGAGAGGHRGDAGRDACRRSRWRAMPRPNGRSPHASPCRTPAARGGGARAGACVCPTAAAATLRKRGEDVTEVLDYVPASFRVIRHVRPRYACGDCDAPVQAPTPSLPIERGKPGPGLVAHVLCAKYCDHLPLYRQSEIYAREGVDLARSTMADWVGRASGAAGAADRRAARPCLRRRPAARRRHAGAGARPRPRQDQDRAALGLCPRRSARRRREDAARRLLPLQPRPQGRASAGAPEGLRRRAARRRLRRLQRHLRARGPDGAARVLEAACWAHVRRKFFDLTTASRRRSPRRRSSASASSTPSRPASAAPRPTSAAGPRRRGRSSMR